MNIRTELACPPDHWAAVDDDTYDGPGSPIGAGRSEQEAIDDLMQQMEIACSDLSPQPGGARMRPLFSQLGRSVMQGSKP